VEPIPDGFFKRASELANRLNNWKRELPVLIVGHRDGDGISAASVLFQGLKALEFRNLTTKILLSPDLEKMKNHLDEVPYGYVITADIGAGFETLLKENVEDFIIADHHPNENNCYGENQLNPCNYGMNDEIDCSGSTIAALIFTKIFPDHFWATPTGKVILCYAIAGAVSDFQMSNGPVSVNKYITEIAVTHEAVKMQKDISLFGRGLYPVSVALNRSGLPGLEDLNYCRFLLQEIIQQEEDGQWKRIIDLTLTEKQELMSALTHHFLTDVKMGDYTSKLIEGVINYVYDLVGLEGWDCTLLTDGRATLDAREILHRVNYVCRRGKADLALELLNNRHVDPTLWHDIETHHRTGDREVAQALELYEAGRIPLESWDDRIIMADFTDIIYYDEVGVVAGVIMKKHPHIELMMSYCEMEDNIVKLSVRAREDVWSYVEKNTEQLGDAKQVYHTIRRLYPNKIMQYGGHRFACSGHMSRTIIPEFFKKMVNYYQQLQPPNARPAKNHKKVSSTAPKEKSNQKKGQWTLDQFSC